MAVFCHSRGPRIGVPAGPGLSFPPVFSGNPEKRITMNTRLPLMRGLIRNVTRHGASPGPRSLNEQLPMAVFNLSEDT